MEICLVLGVARTIIHIGMPRCASTFFQREVFSKFEGFHFYGVETSHYSNTFQKLLYQDESKWDLESARAFAERLPGSNRIFSNELFSGQTAFINAGNRSRTARRLRDLFPDAEILLFVRNQVSLLESLYSIAVYGGFSGTPQDFIKIPDDQINYHTFEPGEHLDSFRYSNLVETYRNLFHEVHLVVFEDFSSNPSLFVEQLLSRLAIETDGKINIETRHNQSLSRRQLALLRILNRWKPLINREDNMRLLEIAPEIDEQKNVSTRYLSVPDSGSRTADNF
ncbi:MAG: hypothetical protein LC664_00630 [Flavobacteriales bacterium]|nr:hypothetical protein [Flavobacteriales bacterium]